MGRRAVFLRLTGCNLKEKCSLDCDTKYAWDGGKDLEIREVREKLFDLLDEDEILVITGGEPMLEEESLKALNSPRLEPIIVETNGTITPSENWANFWSVSPHSDIDYQEWRRLDNVYFKFVCSNDHHLDSVDKIVDRENLDEERIWIMPEGYTEEKLVRSRSNIKERVLDSDYNYSDRLQILLWGGRRGT